MDVSDIVDSGSFERWLNETKQPREVCVGLAHRAAMRVLPIAWDWAQTSQTDDLTPLLFLRCNLLTSGAYWQKVPEENIHAAAAAAYAAAAAAYAAASDIAFAVYAAAGAASDIAQAAAAHPADTAGQAAAAVATAAQAAHPYSSLRQDCQNILDISDWLNQPLWEDMPDDMAAMWTDLAQSLRAEAARTNEATATYDPKALDWTFFVDWYNRALDPQKKPQFSEDLLTKIIVTGDVDWEAKPAVVLGQINAIWARHKVKNIIRDKPFPIKLGIDPGTTKLVSLNLEDIDLAAVIKRLRSALREFTIRCRDDKSQNKLGEQMERAYKSTIKLLRKDISKYKADPLELFDALARAVDEFRDISIQEGFHREPTVARLIRDVGGARENICVAEPVVLSTERKRSDVRLELYTKEQIQKLIALSAGMSLDSKGQLKASIVIAMNILCSPETKPDERKHAFYLLSAVLPRGADALSGYLAENEEGAAKRSSMIDKLATAGDKANKIDKGIDAVQEAVAESGVSGDWLLEFITQVQSGSWLP